MTNWLTKTAKYAKRTLATLALASALTSNADIIQNQDYSQYLWNTPTTFRKEPSWSGERITNLVSKVTLIATNLENNISELKFYIAGGIDTNFPIYYYNGNGFTQAKEVLLENNHNTSWQIQSIKNLGKSPDIFGLEKNLLWVEEDNQTNYVIRIDSNRRVFNRDIFEVQLATTNNQTYSNFTLDLDLITPEKNAINETNISLMAVFYTKIQDQYGTHYYGYINPIFGTLENKLDASQDDWNTNGLPNAFEATYSAGPTNLNPDIDTDNDGMKNIGEFYAGTNPTNENSVLRMNTPIYTNNNQKLSWQGSTLNFFYQPINYKVNSTTNIMDTESWSPIKTNLNALTYSDTNTNQKAFYRVEVEVKPDLPEEPFP
jgi:hypothetical protein